MRRRTTLSFLLVLSCGGDAATSEATPPTSETTAGEGVEASSAGEGDGEPTMQPRETSVDTAQLGDVFFVHDIQGLHGGWAMYVHGDRATVVEVDPREAARGERRWERPVDAQWLETARTAVASALVAEVPDRPGIPDEARTVIVATAPDGVRRNAAWEGQRDPSLLAFWSPVQELRRLSRVLVADAEPSFVGRFDYTWRPTGVEWPSL